MSVVTATACKPYTGTGPILPNVSIVPEDFGKVAVAGPGLPTIMVTREERTSGDVYEVSFGFPAGGSRLRMAYQLEISSNGVGVARRRNTEIAVTFPYGNEGYYNTICGNTSPNAAINTLRFVAESPGLTQRAWQITDFYEIRVRDCCTNTKEFPAVSVTFNRIQEAMRIEAGGGSVIDTEPTNNANPTSVLQVEPSCTGCACFTADSCGKFRVPYIDMSGSTTSGNLDVGPIQFTICDEMTYYRKKCNTKCGMYYIDPERVKQTKILRADTSMVSVVRGEGATLYNKVANIWLNEDVPIEFEEFYKNIIIYGMAKFLFAYLLTGKFDINYLLGKYNDSLVRRLGKSRFCRFVETFLDCETSAIYDYNKYFLHSK